MTLEFIQFARNQPQHACTRIVLRTGQPGYAPEHETIQRYDINDYRTKSELTHQRLITTVMTAIRSYQQLRTIDASRQAMEKIVRYMATMNDVLGKDSHLRLLRIQGYVALLCKKLAHHPDFYEALGAPSQQEQMVKASVLYDIGKLGVADHIVCKPGPLNDEEWEMMQTHAGLGSQVLQGVIDEIHTSDTNQFAGSQGANSNLLSFLEVARDMALSHHEKWDGSGYPLGLEGSAIPACARILALADVYDAMLSRRVHKMPLPREDVVRFIGEQSGKHFDPAVVTAFCNVEPHLYELWCQHTEHWERV